MIRCAWCGAKNYAIDMWCARCRHHLDWQPAQRRRRSAVFSVLTAAAAAAGVAMAITLPAAGGFTGSVRFALPGLPNTGSGETSAIRQDRPASKAAATPGTTPTAEATPSDSAAPADSAPPLDVAPSVDPAPSGLAAAPPVLAVPPVQVQPAPAIQSAGDDPAAAVDQFYQAVSAHRFDLAASLWSSQMRAAYPPAVYIDQRFADTQRIGVGSQRVLADAAGSALVYVDVLEVIGGQTREWVGTWQLIQGGNGWLLNSPSLRAG